MPTAVIQHTLNHATGSVVYSRAAIKKRLIDERNGKLKDTILQNTLFPTSKPPSSKETIDCRA
jgi:hypothetical protein